MGKLSRRSFGKSAALAGAATALSYSRTLGANERIRVGFIGLGNRGDQVLDAFLVHKDCDVPVICDLYQPYLDFAAKKIGSNPRQTPSPLRHARPPTPGRSLSLLHRRNHRGGFGTQLDFLPLRAEFHS